jgi:nicotinamide-nucleotide amidase
MQQPLQQPVQEVAGLLAQLELRLVLAESCTGGLVSACLARVPGISEYHCGSAVVYRLDTKTRWLAVEESMLIEIGPVSEPVARAMARGVLDHTPEAHLSASITGHLGPGAPEGQDGLVFVAVAWRDGPCQVESLRLSRFQNATDGEGFIVQNEREWRQWKATEFVFEQLIAALHMKRGDSVQAHD